jgi:hypothetical protein
MTRRSSALFFICLIFVTTTLADTKLKVRQTMQGQSFENTTYIKGKRQRSEQNMGGQNMSGQNMGGMEIVSITQCDLRRNLRVMPASKAYVIELYDIPSETTTEVKPAPTTKSKPLPPPHKGGVITTILNVKDTGERKQMFGYTARHLFITMETESSPDACTQQKSKMQIEGWYIDATFGTGCDDQRYTNYRPTSAHSTGCQDRYEMKQRGSVKRGYPVWEKMTMFDENGKETYSFTNEVIELSSANLDPALFDIPAGYREVKDASELYASVAANHSSNQGQAPSAPSNNLVSAMPSAKSNAQPASAVEVGTKKTGVVRFGLSNVKVSAVGEGLNAAELATAIQNSLNQYLKAPNIEIVPLEAVLPAALEAEAKQKECDYVIYANVAHKKGSGGGFGKAFSGVIAPTVGRIGIGHTGSVAGNIAGQVATAAIVSAGTMAANVKAKDEVTLDVRLQAPGNATPATSKQLKAKAKADGEDILTPMIEQAAQAILDVGAKR